MAFVDVDEVMKDAECFSAFTGNLAGLSDLAILLSGNPIDAVPVVRCKDCKYGKYLRGATADAYTCSLGWGLSGIVAEKDFCSYGNRKDGADRE